jgi:hypothetical protein
MSSAFSHAGGIIPPSRETSGVVARQVMPVGDLVQTFSTSVVRSSKIRSGYAGQAAGSAAAPPQSSSSKRTPSNSKIPPVSKTGEASSGTLDTTSQTGAPKPTTSKEFDEEIIKFHQVTAVGWGLAGLMIVVFLFEFYWPA